MNERDTETTGNCVTVEYDPEEKAQYYSEDPDGLLSSPAVQRLFKTIEKW